MVGNLIVLISKKLLPLLFLASLLGAGLAYGQAPDVTFTGKITEISKSIDLGVMRSEQLLVIKLDNSPNTQFKISRDEAVRAGIIETSGVSPVLTPAQTKGIGWKVKLFCKNQGTPKAPNYRVKSLERISE
jgi:hypothetical protein